MEQGGQRLAHNAESSHQPKPFLKYEALKPHEGISDNVISQDSRTIVGKRTSPLNPIQMKKKKDVHYTDKFGISLIDADCV
ncbi:hypothetical protein TNIN_306801 [Trichonephila inaurata madagascariensis]|uniref:Uncharacterized protein n=1 Tax=Trichonephila inaurata madagascariensis TaxID=2747483 RepID=A0A8X6X1W3_9ARAC|nr:hypothetical protein TNIN_306801 [Trichonephila inaurata madagascariensis]